uniref:DALR anticodon-binding domain-containing protein 3 n=1 Tax=Ceratitis capitata TaxID=7213 RepID=W8C8L5_CERCA
MTNPTAVISKNLCLYLLEKPSLFPCVEVPKNAINFIRIHKEKLSVKGDFSFPCSLDLWKNCCKETGHKLRLTAFDMFKEVEEDICNNERQKFLKIASRWAIPIDRIRIDNERCFLYLKRHTVMLMLLQRVLNNDKNEECYGKLKKNPKQKVWLSGMKLAEQQHEELSFCRAKLVENILLRVLEYSQWTVVTEEYAEEARKGNIGEVLMLNVASAAGKVTVNPFVIPPSRLSYATIRCGIVIDPITGKLTKLKTSEYLSCRSNDMCLMAMHKYGVRIKDDKSFSALMSRLGAAAVTVDLMEVRHSSPVQIIRSGKGSTRGAAFILYNSARLESLLRKFEEKVENGEYGKLPPIESIDFALLDEDVSIMVIFYIELNLLFQ